jgi:hypothetical protein
MVMDIKITPDTKPPTITSVSPEKNAQNVTVNSIINITFSEPMDDSVFYSSILILPPIEFKMSWLNNRKNLFITPTTNLTHYISYSITISTLFSDIVENHLENNYNWYFTIERLDTDKDGEPDDTDSDDDNDGISDEDDHFQLDPAASIDLDGDNHPDKWNMGKSKENSITGLTLDKYPLDPKRWTDETNGEGDDIDFESSGESVISFSALDTLDIIIKGQIAGENASLFRWIMDTDDSCLVTSDEVEVFEVFMMEFSQWAATQDSGITLDGVLGNMTFVSYEIEGAEGENSNTVPFFGRTHLRFTFHDINIDREIHYLNLTLFSDEFAFNLTMLHGYQILDAKGLKQLNITTQKVTGITDPTKTISISFEKVVDKPGNNGKDKDQSDFISNYYVIIMIIIIIIFIIIPIFSQMRKKRKKMSKDLKEPDQLEGMPVFKPIEDEINEKLKK